MKLPDSLAASVIEAEVKGINDHLIKVWFIGFADGRRLLCVDQMASLLMPERGVALLDLINAGCDLITGRNVLFLISRLTKSQRKKRPKVGIENKQTTILI